MTTTHVSRQDDVWTEAGAQLLSWTELMGSGYRRFQMMHRPREAGSPHPADVKPQQRSVRRSWRFVLDLRQQNATLRPAAHEGLIC